MDAASGIALRGSRAAPLAASAGRPRSHAHARSYGDRDGGGRADHGPNRDADADGDSFADPARNTDDRPPDRNSDACPNDSA